MDKCRAAPMPPPEGEIRDTAPLVLPEGEAWPDALALPPALCGVPMRGRVPAGAALFTGVPDALPALREGCFVSDSCLPSVPRLEPELKAEPGKERQQRTARDDERAANCMVRTSHLSCRVADPVAAAPVAACR